jgi:predicted nucleic acid-binding protein
VDVIDEPPELGRTLCQLGAIEQAAPKRWMDAYLAAFAITADLALISLDQDFRQFEPEGLTLQLLQVAGNGDPAP